ncbi:hypothetical protein ACQ86N_06415 [Puia sp. P3]|uniref:hypothetical protein n=1 Tax=Puia sp. P3 TaxID=3423952 RepID=UPI003D66AFCC
MSTYYNVNIDTRFTEVTAKGPLPEIDARLFSSHLSHPELMVWLKQHLPLNLFRFEGINAMTLTDVTTEYVMDSMKNIILDSDCCGTDVRNQKVIQFLKTLAHKTGVEIGLVRFPEGEWKAGVLPEICRHSVLAEAFTDDAMAKSYQRMVEDYFLDPQQLVYESLPAQQPGRSFSSSHCAGLGSVVMR